MMFLFSFFILMKIQGWDNPKHINVINTGISNWMVTFNENQKIEYQQAVEMISKHIPNNSLCFEYIPDHKSRLLPASVTAGGLEVILYWTTWNDDDIKQTQYVIKWLEHSTLIREPTFEYKYVNLEEMLKQFLESGKYEKIDSTNTCELWRNKYIHE